MARQINVILGLKDKMSSGLKKASQTAKDAGKAIETQQKKTGDGMDKVGTKTEKAAKQAERAKRKVVNFATHSANKINNLTNKVAKMATGFGAAVGAIAVKKGLSEAMDLEGYKTQLETATKDTKKASDIMKYAVNLANKTPFEGGQLVEGASKFEAMGMSAKKWLGYAGDMAGATNKDFDQATEALIDAQTGELERLKEFGITKTMITKKGAEMFKNTQIVNNKGQITDQEKFNEAMMALMKDKFAGGMEKQSKTLRGTISTITGVAKSGLASIMGMGSDGTIKKGSVMDVLKDKAQDLANTFQKWQSDGTIDNIANKATRAVKKVLGWVKQAIQFVKKHKDFSTRLAKLIPIILGITAATAKGIVIATKVNKTIKKTREAMKLLNILGLGPVAIAIAAIIAIGILLYLNWDKIKKAAGKLAQGCKKAFKAIKDRVSETVENAKKKKDKVIEKAKDMKDKVIDSFKKMGKGIKDAITAPFKWITDKFKTIKKAAKWVKDKVSETETREPRPGANANGTKYWKGGPTTINEHGQEVVDLPSGTRIYPANKSKKMGSGGINLNLNVTVQGNVIGNKEYTRQLGEELSKDIILAIENV